MYNFGKHHQINLMNLMNLMCLTDPKYQSFLKNLLNLMYHPHLNCQTNQMNQ